MKQVLFIDMDGVLIDTEIVYARCLRAALRIHGYAVPEEELYAFSGLEFRTKYRRLREEWGVSLPLEQLLTTYRSLQLKELEDFRPLLKPGVLPTLPALREAGYLLGLCTSNERHRVDKVLADTGMTELFSLVLTGESVERRKPAPDIYLQALARISLPREACLAVEDSVFGIQAAKAAGLTVAAIPDRRFPYVEGAADYELESMAQLPCLLKRLNGEAAPDRLGAAPLAAEGRTL